MSSKRKLSIERTSGFSCSVGSGSGARVSCSFACSAAVEVAPEDLEIRTEHPSKVLHHAVVRCCRGCQQPKVRWQLWDYQREGWARRFFEEWRDSLKWQRLEPFEKFAVMIDRHWDGIAAYCRPENKVSLGFVEGLNNKIRVIQRKSYGLRDEDYLRLKVLTCMLPEH